MPNEEDPKKSLYAKKAYMAVFEDPANGTPDNISKQGCMALAKLGVKDWNEWRKDYPVIWDSKNAQKNKADFSDVDFRETPCDFTGFDFGDYADFSNATFCDHTTFSNAIFGDHATFSNASFGDTAFNEADFFEEIFGTWTNFSEATFGDWTNFSNASFSSGVDFTKARFDDYADFSNAIFGGITNFSQAEFKGAALFHGSKLYQDINFDQAKFSDTTDSGQAMRAYRSLKLAFSQQQAIREEQRFFRLEMDEELSLAWKRREWKRYVPLWLYKFASNWGFSIGRPLIGLLSAFFVFALIYRIGYYGWSENARLSLLNSFPGFERLVVMFFADSAPSFWLIIMLIIQKLFALIMLFLIGLALRNHFKMK